MAQPDSLLVSYLLLALTDLKSNEQRRLSQYAFQNVSAVTPKIDRITFGVKR
jgi:hypothetical protein